MSVSSKGFLEKSKPWRADAKWPVVAVEAVLLIILGLYMLIDSSGAGNAILQIIGLVLLIVSVQVAIGAFRGKEAGLGAFDSFRAGIGATAGVIAISLWWSETVPNQAVRLILGWALIAYPAFQLVGQVVVRGKGGFRPAALMLSALTLVLGILLLTSNDDTAAERVTFLGVVFLVFGVLLGGLAYLIRSRNVHEAV